MSGRDRHFWPVYAAVLFTIGLPSGLSAQIDAVFTNLDQTGVCFGDGNGGFSCSEGGEGGFRVALDFVNGDTNLDAVFANPGWPDPQPNRVCLGDGSGGFSCSDVSADANSTQEVALGLVDGDNRLDAVFANWYQPNRVCLGDGSGGFSCSDVSADTNGTRGVALGFVDHDPNLDAVFCVGGWDSVANRVCLGDGSGNFSCSDIPGGPNEPECGGVALGYVDDDWNLDVVIAERRIRDLSGDASAPNILCLGDGNGGFSCSYFSSGCTTGLALGYVNGDGRLDVVFANRPCGKWGIYDGGENFTCLGDGNGGFSCSEVSSDANWTEGVALGFVNDDWNLDAVFANFPGPNEQAGSNRVCLGDGHGGFTCSDVSVAPDTFTSSVALGELGTPEIFADGFESGDTSTWSDTEP